LVSMSTRGRFYSRFTRMRDGAGTFLNETQREPKKTIEKRWLEGIKDTEHRKGVG